MGYGLEPHETDGYKSPRAISASANEKGRRRSTQNAPDSALLLHPSPTEEIFKDSPWVISPPLLLFLFLFSNSPSLLSLVLQAGNRCLKCSGSGLQKDVFCAAPLGSQFYSHGGLLLLLHRVAPSQCCGGCDSGRMFKSRSD